MLTLIRNNFYRIFIFGVIILCFFATIVISRPTLATNYQTVDSSQLTELFSDSLSRSLQGATITKNYFIYTDWGCDTCKTNLIACKRSQPSNCKTLASGDWGHASTVYHKWGSKTVTVVENGSKSQQYENHCINIKTGEEVSGCEEIRPSGLGSDGDDDSSWLQGYTWYGDYALRGWGYSPETRGVNKLLIYKDGLDTVLTLPSFIYEIEGVGVDGSTGEVVIIVKAPNRSTIKFYKISSSVLNLGSGSDKREAKESAAQKKDASDYAQEAYIPSVSTYDGVVETSLFGTIQDDKEGCGVYTTLDFIMTMLTIGIGISATIGIAVSGIIYLTAKGDVAKTTKAKRRIYEIVIGLAVYAVIWALLTFLLPEFNPELKACKALTAEEIAARDTRIAAIRAENAKKTSSASGATNESIEQCLKNAAKVVRNQVCKLKTPAERISATAKLLAGSSNAPNAKYQQAMKETGANSSGPCEVNGESCNTYVATVLLASGVDPNVPNGKAGNNTADLYNYFSKSPKWKKVGNSPGLSREGDVVVKPRPNGHVTITVKKPTGKLVTAHASYCDFYPIVSNSIFDDYDGTPTVFRYVGK